MELRVMDMNDTRGVFSEELKWDLSLAEYQKTIEVCSEESTKCLSMIEQKR